MNMAKEIPKPDDDDPEENSYALIIHDDGQFLYQYERVLADEPEWKLKKRYDHEEIPPLNFTEARIEQLTNGNSVQIVAIYAADISVDGQSGSSIDDDSDDGDTGEYGNNTNATDSRRGYCIRFSDGTMIPGDDRAVHTTQSKNMAEAVRFLVTDHDLIDQIDIPHFPPRARRNCTINDEPEHPEGHEMPDPARLPGGYYLHTALNNHGKRKRIEDLAEAAGLSVEFLGDW